MWPCSLPYIFYSCLSCCSSTPVNFIIDPQSGVMLKSSYIHISGHSDLIGCNHRSTSWWRDPTGLSCACDAAGDAWPCSSVFENPLKIAFPLPSNWFSSNFHVFIITVNPFESFNSAIFRNRHGPSVTLGRSRAPLRNQVAFLLEYYFWGNGLQRRPTSWSQTVVCIV